jgi:hypothetical protein
MILVVDIVNIFYFLHGTDYSDRPQELSDRTTTAASNSALKVFLSTGYFPER